MIENIFIDDLKERGVEVTRNSPFTRYQDDTNDGLIRVTFGHKTNDSTTSVKAEYLVGCDGARSMVRQSIPGAVMEGDSSRAPWGVLDGMNLVLGYERELIRDRSNRDGFPRFME